MQYTHFHNIHVLHPFSANIYTICLKIKPQIHQIPQYIMLSTKLNLIQTYLSQALMTKNTESWLSNENQLFLLIP
jgi:hypothetical protein